MDLGLQNKIALVVASSSGLGFAAAEALLGEGARVVICGRDAERLTAATQTLRDQFGERAVAAMQMDVLNSADNQRLVEFTVAQFGGLDILITNAGGPPGGSFDSTDLEAWQRGIDLTLMSAAQLVKAALPYLRKSEAASILTVTSISVKEPITGLLLSNVIRPAVVGLTKALSQELGPEGIRANSILPGWTSTERVTYIFENRAKTNGTTIDAETAKVTDAIPLKRMATPQEFGRVAAFLVSPAASYVNGVMMQVDGGLCHGLL
ncbi:MAG: SDR family oxidoreductase [Anaerolineae bacterium]|nr:SDR family oxidoreductase [Anaerolineae bacterium]